MDKPVMAAIIATNDRGCDASRLVAERERERERERAFSA
jgi:hypothetical protein